MTGVPFENSGGAQRAAQLSKALVNRGHVVNYIYAIDYREKESRGIKIPPKNFNTYHINKFDVYGFLKDLDRYTDLIILVEVPHPKFLPIIQILKPYSFKIIYDLIDPWDTELGQNWYNGAIEYRIIKLSDILIATAKKLQEKLMQKSGKNVLLIPNAYDDELFVKSTYKQPLDLPSSPILGYIGSLWGSWFDIELIIKTAMHYPNYNLVLIGEYQGQFEQIKTPNIHFLGLKSQSSLPTYLSYFHIGLIPFKVNRLTEGVNPLKVYEYLAMGLPVVSTHMPEIQNIPGVYSSRTPSDFIKNIETALENTMDLKAVDSWLKKNTWNSRLEQLFELIYDKN